jgi:hypothetical protein
MNYLSSPSFGTPHVGRLPKTKISPVSLRECNQDRQVDNMSYLSKSFEFPESQYVKTKSRKWRKILKPNVWLTTCGVLRLFFSYRTRDFVLACRFTNADTPAKRTESKRAESTHSAGNELSKQVNPETRSSCFRSRKKKTASHAKVRAQ